MTASTNYFRLATMQTLRLTGIRRFAASCVALAGHAYSGDVKGVAKRQPRDVMFGAGPDAGGRTS
jgi:hypothetical protein